MWIFSPDTSPRVPPFTVKSCEKTHTFLPFDSAEAGYDAVGVGPFVLGRPLRAALGEHVELLEGPGVEEIVDAFAGRHLAARVLTFDRRVAPGMERCLAPPLELLQALLHRLVDHGRKASGRGRMASPPHGRCTAHEVNVVVGLGGENLR